jgi:hypothetical protein
MFDKEEKGSCGGDKKKRKRKKKGGKTFISPAITTM